MSFENVLEFWFGTLQDELDFPAEKSSIWFRKSDETDALIRDRYQLVWTHAHEGTYDVWTKIPHGRLALIIILDQFSRNMFRGTPQAFAGDKKALELAREGVRKKMDRDLYPIQRVFMYMPFEHSENLEDQNESVRLFTNLLEEVPDQLKRPMNEFLRYAKAHRDIIKQYGRFPHRNQTLGRTTTPEELAFLKKPGSSF
ncbi:MAG TPA: DUF924 family protein [Bdellovibrionales bacterium]|nr:DUF924 family protein [Bdellovibrionales bacterium]